MKIDEERNKYFEKQYLQGSGFCGICGRGINPSDVKTFGKCPYSGHHPDMNKTIKYEKP